MLRGVLLLVVFSTFSCFAADSPVLVTVLTDNTKSLHLGGYDRTRFDLVETFHPLQTAAKANERQMNELKEKAVQRGEESTSEEDISAQPSSGEAIVGGQTTIRPQRVVFGDWTEWTAWTGCANGERYRLRTCVSKRPALKVVCHGPAKEVQKCYTSQEHHVLVAADPWTIEREIQGEFKA